VDSYLLKKEIDEKTLRPCYFFYGEEPFLAEEFVEELKQALFSFDRRDQNIEKFDLAEQSWMEVLDLARTIPFFFSSRRIIVVNIPMGKGDKLSSIEERIIKDYFSSPSSHTVLVVIYPGRLRRGSPLFRLFSSLPSSLVWVKELKVLKDRTLFEWMERYLSSLEKTANKDAMARLAELTGNNLARISREFEKVAAYVGEKKIIELDDVNSVSGWVKSFYEWEIVDNLEKAEFEKSLLVLDNLFKEGVRPEYVLGITAKFFRDVFLAKLWLKEKEKDRRGIFRELRPHIQERFGNFYSTKFREFFALVDKISMRTLKMLLAELEEIDLKIKTSDLSAQTLLEGFLFDYCQMRKGPRAI
jgi:DNA polymerase III delta subunit